MSCSSSAMSCCQKPIVSVCLPEHDYTVTDAGVTLFGPNPSPVAASGILANTSTSTAAIDFVFLRGAQVVATMSAVASGQSRAFAVNGFTSITATSTSTVPAALANLCMTEFFRPAI